MASPRRSRPARFIHRNKGTCSTEVAFSVVNGRMHNVVFTGGCKGNTQGVARMVEGCAPDEVLKRLKGILCGDKPTSCPDQLARAIEAWKRESSRA